MTKSQPMILYAKTTSVAQCFRQFTLTLVVKVYHSTKHKSFPWPADWPGFYGVAQFSFYDGLRPKYSFQARPWVRQGEDRYNHADR